MAVQYDRSAGTLTLLTAHTAYQMKIGPFGYVLRDERAGVEVTLLYGVILHVRGGAGTRYLCCRGLQEDAWYRDADTGARYSGAALMYAGLPLPALPEYGAWQMHLVRE